MGEGQHKLRVLVAEDSGIVRLGIIKTLTSTGHEVVAEADNGVKAVDAVCSERPDVVIMDISMPELDGLGAARKIQQCCPTPVVIMTAYDSSDLIEEAGKAGAGAYLVKPPKPGELDRAMAIAVARHADLMEIKAARQAIETQKERLSLFVRHTPVAIAMFDRELNCMAASKQWLDNYCAGESDTSPPCCDGVLPGPRNHWRQVHKRCLEGKTEKCEEERFDYPDGSFDWVRWEVHPWRTEDGEVGGIVMFTEVITEIKRLREEAAEKQQLESAQKVISGVAHEIRNPLFGISNIAQILRNESENPAHLKLLDTMLKEINRISSMVSELTLYVRKSPTHKARVELAPFLSGICTAQDFEGFNLNIKQGLQVNADSVKLTVILQNLLKNAVQAEASKVDIAAEKTSDNKVVITIKDNGEGVSAETHRHMFEPFFTTRKGRSGLGLAICRKFIDEHGGSIDICGNPGKGTSVTLKLDPP